MGYLEDAETTFTAENIHELPDADIRRAVVTFSQLRDLNAEKGNEDQAERYAGIVLLLMAEHVHRKNSLSHAHREISRARAFWSD